MFQIRRGSEPSLNKSPQHHAYRQFVTATPVSDFVQHPPYASSSSSTLVPQQLHEDEEGGGSSEAFDSLPDSVAAAPDSKGSLNVLRRREPLGASAGNNNKQEKRAGGGGSEQQQQQHQLSLAPTNEVGGAALQRQQMVRPSVEIIIPNEIGKNNGFKMA